MKKKNWGVKAKINVPFNALKKSVYLAIAEIEKKWYQRIWK